MTALLLLSLALAASQEEAVAHGWILENSPHQTGWTIRHSGVPGPTVVIVGGIHGNEPAGAYAAEQIRHWTIRKGVLVVIPRANPTALDADTRRTPDAGEDLGDLNRNFPKVDGNPDRPRGRIAKGLWEFVRQQRPDWLIDLHEGYDFGRINKKSVGSSIIDDRRSDTKEARALMLEAVNAGIDEEKQKFMSRGPPVNGSLARAASVHLRARAMILETTFKDQRLSRRARQHRVMVHRLLTHLGMLDPAVTPERMIAPGRAPKVALYDASGSTGPGIPRLLSLLGRGGKFAVTRVSPEDIRHGALAQFDLVIFSGGSGSGQAKAIEAKGRTEVAGFVRKGGGYVGICAGSYLACRGFSWGLGILDAKTASPKWRRGRAMVQVEQTDQGGEILGPRAEWFEFKYANGPILVPAGDDAIPDFTTLAYFRTEVAENDTPKGIMVDTPAVVAAPFGKGRVVCFSPHPEQTEGLEDMVLRAAAWAAGKD